MAVNGDKEKFYLSLDLGTTSTRAHVIDKNFKIVGGARFESTLIQEPQGASELEPNEYFESIVKILQDALTSAKVDVIDVVNIGISCQRATFITWDKNTSEPFHNLITWKDERGNEIQKKFNKSFLLKVCQQIFFDSEAFLIKVFNSRSVSTAVPRFFTLSPAWSFSGSQAS